MGNEEKWRRARTGEKQNKKNKIRSRPLMEF